MLNDFGYIDKALPRQVPHHRQRGVARARLVHKLSRSPHHFLFHARPQGYCEAAGIGAVTAAGEGRDVKAHKIHPKFTLAFSPRDLL